VKRYLNRARPLALLLAIVLCSTVAAPPAAATEPKPARPLAAAAASAGEALPEAAVAQATQAPATPTATAPAAAVDGKPFFKTTTGVIAVALLAGGLGYMAYSWSNDRVNSPGR
jgi:hypothetical protein